MAYEVKIKGLTKLNKVVSGYSKLNKQQKAVNKNLKSQKQLTDKLTSSTTGKIQDLGNKFKELSGNDILSRPLNAMSKGFEASRKKGGGLFSSAKKGLGGMGKAISRMGGLTKVLGAVFKSAMRILLPLTLIMGAIALVKKLFQLNVGGIATSFFKIVGEVKSAIGKMMAWINRSLRKLGPIFKMVINPLVMKIRFVFAIIKGIFKSIGMILNPIIDVLAEIGNAFSGIFGTGEAKSFEKVLKGISKYFEILGKVIGFIVKVGLLPLRIMFKIIGYVITKMVESWKKSFQKLFEFFKPFINFITKVINFFKERAAAAKESAAAKREEFNSSRLGQALGAGGSTNNSTKNDNRKISVFTNAGIDAGSFNEDSAVRSIRG